MLPGMLIRHRQMGNTCNVQMQFKLRVKQSGMLNLNTLCAAHLHGQRGLVE